ncbi:MAG TPA: AAA family ATPase [Syntrophales bacterium]|nr:AAA family ATPase [Syntrophales bacterium]
MDYFKILNLKREPFSNSPEPDFFFGSAKHVGCLQKLELAVRLRRGLSVVMGDVGTGKTTLCRQLILKFSASEEDSKQIETHLILDPSFTNPIEFLSSVALTFGISTNGESSEWQLKEDIKNYLFAKGVDEGKIVVLIIDEGQKLPDFCLELLREFLNYETNQFKLLQIVIFAQREFEQILKKKKNFADRVNFYYLLGPLNFRETQGMVKFRISRASDAAKAPPLFSYPGLLALYLATGGYPRKIVTLCHQVILALIIQNKSKAGWFLVRSCSRRVSAEKKKLLKWATASLLAVIVAFALAAGFYPAMIFQIWPRTDAVETVRTETASSLRGPGYSSSAVSATAEDVKSVAVDRGPEKDVPEFLGKVELRSGRTIWRLLNDFYGDFDKDLLRKVARANPHIRNLARVSAGEVIELPAIPAKDNPLGPGKCWVRIARSGQIGEVYELYKNYLPSIPSLYFLPYWNSREGLGFAVVMKEGFANLDDAIAAARRLPQPLAANAEVFAKVSDDTVFFKR